MIRSLAVKRAKIATLCWRFHVRRLDLFGSAARRTDFLETSDVDLLVEYEPNYSPPTLSEFFALRECALGSSRAQNRSHNSRRGA